MMNNQIFFRKAMLLSTMSVGAFMFAQSTPDSLRSKQMDEVVITGNSNPKASIKTSTSISTLKMDQIEKSAPRTTAEIFRTIPGIRSESSGGEGNSNITVRGVPVSAGGSRYLLIQEDGLPVLQFGDIAFGTQDQFTRFDAFVSRVEALRGGSASIFASNSPAGIINFITNKGTKKGGSITQQVGLNYKNFRTDINYGAPLGNKWYLGVGGFYRIGDGPRKTGFNSNNGGQLRLSLMKKFKGGNIRVYGKYLNDRTAAYMPMPMSVTGSNSNPDWSSLSNYDALSGALQTENLSSDQTLDHNGNVLNSDMKDGMHSVSKSVGLEFNYKLGDGWKISEKARYSANDGQFLAPFPASVGSYTDILGSYDHAYYAGTNDAVSTTGNYMLIHLFNTKLNNFNNFFNDFNVSKKFGKVKANVGLFNGIQKLNMSWHWNSYLQEVSDDNARMIEVYDAAGTNLSPNGLLAYGVPAWDGGSGALNRHYDTTYNVVAPYAQVEFEPVDGLSVDLGMRYDMGKVEGDFYSGTTTTKDVNGNGVIDANEQTVAVTDMTNGTKVDYKYNIFGYSIGANYAIDKKNAVFARVSKGGSASADRILFNSYDYTNSDDPGLDAVKVNEVSQIEAGYKLRGRGYFLNTTIFHAKTVEANYEATTQRKTENTYLSTGVELDGYYRFSKKFDLRGGLTFTDAKIDKSLNADQEGNTPRRTPALMYSLAPTGHFGKFSAGLTMVGASKAYTQDNNELKMPGYVLVNPFVSYQFTDKLGLSVNANNIFNTIAITEAEEGAIPANNIVRARALTGTSVVMSVKYEF